MTAADPHFSVESPKSMSLLVTRSHALVAARDVVLGFTGGPQELASPGDCSSGK